MSAREQQVKLAFELLDTSKKSLLGFRQVQQLLMSFGVRPCEQSLESHLSRVGWYDLQKVTSVVNQIIPVEDAKRRLVKTLISEDIRQEIAITGNKSKTAVDGLVYPDQISEVLSGWGLTEAEISDAFSPFMTPDGQLEYCQLADWLFDS